MSGVSLDIPRNRNRFLRIINDAAHTNRVSDWERGFLADMKKYYDNRDDMAIAGRGPWNPSVNQWNTMTDIERKL